MKIYVDIDNTICKTNGMDYSMASPLENNIKKINKIKIIAITPNSSDITDII